MSVNYMMKLLSSPRRSCFLHFFVASYMIDIELDYVSTIIFPLSFTRHERNFSVTDKKFPFVFAIELLRKTTSSRLVSFLL